MDLGELAVVPAPDPEQVAHDVALLLAVHLGHVLVRAHLDESVCVADKPTWK